MSLANQPVREYTKKQQLHKVRIKLTQRQMGEISNKVDGQLKERSGNVCELQRKCRGAEAIQRAHITGRKQIDHKTTVNDLLHVCVDCHKWLDETVEGIKYKRLLEEAK
jgi:hypothetical protein